MSSQNTSRKTNVQKPTAIFIALSVLLPVLFQAIALFNPDMVFVDCEERYNAGHALMLLEGHADSWLVLQYRSFCGGCTGTALLGAMIMAIFGSSWLAWKGVCLFVTAVLSYVGSRLLHQQVGKVGAISWVLLLCFAPLNWIRLSLMSWGNHVEAGTIGVVLFAICLQVTERRSHLLLGILCGFALWFGFSTAFAVFGVYLFKILHKKWEEVAWVSLGLLSAPILWGVQWMQTGHLPFQGIYEEDQGDLQEIALPFLQRIEFKLETLFAPQQIAGLWGVPELSIGVPLGIGWLITLLTCMGFCVYLGKKYVFNTIEHRQYQVPLFTAAIVLIWLLMYLLVGFRLNLDPWPKVSAPNGLRYFAPVYPFVLLLLSSIVGVLWETGKRRISVLLIFFPLLSGIVSRAATVTHPFPSSFPIQLDATVDNYFRLQASSLMDYEDHTECTSTQRNSKDLHSYSLGRLVVWESFEDETITTEQLAKRMEEIEVPEGVMEEQWYAGVGGALIDYLDVTGEGSFRTLSTIHSIVNKLPDQGPKLALEEAFWSRVFSQQKWSVARGPVTEARLNQMLAQFQSQPETLKTVWLQSYGRRWGRVETRLAQPSEIPFPMSLSGQDAEVFAHGLGQGIGSKWGPQEVIPAPKGMPESLDAHLQIGYTRGLEEEWRIVQVPEIIRNQSWPDAEKVRWWGEAPPRICNCLNTCE
jgi:hypothetical protein